MSVPSSTPVGGEESEVRRVRSRRSRGRLRAVLAGAGVLGVGAAVTLAAWTDTEWIFGGTDTDAPIGTSRFEVEQNVYDATGFTNRETFSSGGAAGKLNFTVAAASLSPGATVYAPMQLRTTPGSGGGTVVLNGAQQGTGTSAALFTALQYQAKTGVAQSACNATGMAGGTVLTPASSPLSTGGSASFAIGAAPDASTPGTPVDVCFAITMPAGATDQALQGLAVVPVWSFVSTSQS